MRFCDTPEREIVGPFLWSSRTVSFAAFTNSQTHRGPESSAGTIPLEKRGGRFLDVAGPKYWNAGSLNVSYKLATGQEAGYILAKLLIARGIPT